MRVLSQIVGGASLNQIIEKFVKYTDYGIPPFLEKLIWNIVYSSGCVTRSCLNGGTYLCSGNRAINSMSNLRIPFGVPLWLFVFCVNSVEF
jgi:hypothetical protein